MAEGALLGRGSHTWAQPSRATPARCQPPTPCRLSQFPASSEGAKERGWLSPPGTSCGSPARGPAAICWADGAAVKVKGKKHFISGDGKGSFCEWGWGGGAWKGWWYSSPPPPPLGPSCLLPQQPTKGEPGARPPGDFGVGVGTVARAAGTVLPKALSLPGEADITA